MNANCSSLSVGNSVICDGTSVLNDGRIPALNRVSSNPASNWATELFTVRRPGVTSRILLSFEVDSDNHDRMKMAVFNCPEMEISAPLVDVYFLGQTEVIGN